jgi:hypothetical protein
MSGLDGLIKAIWSVGIVTIMVLLFAFPDQFRVAFSLGLVLMIMVFSRRTALFPQINDYSVEMQAAWTFFGWFFLAVFGVAVVSMWFLDGWR